MNGDMITDKQRLNFLEEQAESLFEWWRPDGSFWTVRGFHDTQQDRFRTAREAIDDAMRIHKERSDDDGPETSSE